MKKCLAKRLISFVLSVAVFVTVLPVPSYAADVNSQTAFQQSEVEKQFAAATEKSLEYELNGGSFVEGYQAPNIYPEAELPDWELVEKPGYAFAG